MRIEIDKTPAYHLTFARYKELIEPGVIVAIDNVRVKRGGPALLRVVLPFIMSWVREDLTKRGVATPEMQRGQDSDQYLASLIACYTDLLDSWIGKFVTTGDPTTDGAVDLAIDLDDLLALDDQHEPD